MAKVTWLGDEDPAAQFIRDGGEAFIKGQPVTVDAKHEHLARWKDNPAFAVDGEKADVVEAKEPDDAEIEDRLDHGTEKGALKAELRRLGADVPKGNASVETLRAALAKASH